MSNITSLIFKYGEIGKQNGNDVSLFIDEDNSTFQKRKQNKYAGYTGFNFKTVLLRENVAENDVFVIDGKEYLVLENNRVSKSGSQVYTDVLLFENDFVHTVEVFKQSMSTNSCNLPEQAANSSMTIKARIKTASPQDYLQYSFHNEKVITHVFTTVYEKGIETSDLLSWGERKFEILHLENIDEQDKILVINAIEVLDVN